MPNSPSTFCAKPVERGNVVAPDETAAAERPLIQREKNSSRKKAVVLAGTLVALGESVLPRLVFDLAAVREGFGDTRVTRRQF